MKFFVDRPIAVAMIYLALLVIGVYSFLNTPIELAPQQDFPRITITASWANTSPEVIQTQVTAPLEEIATSIRGVRKMSSVSQIGSAQIILELDPKADMKFVELALREAISRAKTELPYQVRPDFESFVPAEFRTRQFLSMSISGDYTLQELRGMLKDRLELGLRSVQGVASVEVAGGSDPEIRIIIDEARLKALGLDPYSVNYALGRYLKGQPAGLVRRSGREYIFRVAEPVRSASDLGRTIIAHSGGVPIRLSDVAEIRPSYADIGSIHRINGSPTVQMTVVKEEGTNTLKVARRVKERLASIRKDLPPGLIFRTVQDETIEVLKNLHHLQILAGIIIILVFAMIVIILRTVVPSLLILSSIAFSVVITFNFIYLMKIPLNMLTLGALALGFGMFVDNSIVVFENTLRLREKGLDAKQAAVEGAKGVFLPVLASTLTTISVFFCFPFFQGRLRMYYLPLAFVISSAMAASLAVSFTLIPALSPALLKPRGRNHSVESRKRFPGFLRFVLRHPVAVMLVLTGLLYGSYRWFRSEVTLGEFFQWYSKERLSVSITPPSGMNIEQLDALIRKFEDKVMENSYEKQMEAQIWARRATLSISFPPEVERSFRPYVLKEELIRLASQFAGIDVGVSGFDPQGYYSSMSAGTFYDSRLKILGYNLKKLREITDDLEKTMLRNPRIREVRSISGTDGWYRTDSFEYVLKINREALWKHNVDPARLYYQVQTLLAGRFGKSITSVLDGRESTIMIKFPGSESLDLVRLQEALFRTERGEYLRLGDVTSLEEKAIAGSIDRENQQFQRTILWEFRGPSKAAENYKKAVFASLRLPPGFSAILDDYRYYMTGEEKGQIRFAVVFALLIITMILASLYESLVQPFIILCAVPLAMIGVFAAFVLAGYPFDSSAYIGVLLMAGIVVNNAILIVDHINGKRREGRPLLDAVVEGTRERIRPILMTTGTTVFGMLPMILWTVDAGKRDMWSSLALCTIGGLTTSTLFILVVIPIFYIFSERVKSWVALKSQEIQILRRGRS
jgi:hydrophobic/amphiphilic exporter-1 (mainly G- bacteria), HAE1 family